MKSRMNLSLERFTSQSKSDFIRLAEYFSRDLGAIVKNVYKQTELMDSIVQESESYITICLLSV